MNVASLGFLLGCCIAPIVFHALPGVLARQVFLSALNAAFLGTFIANKGGAICLAAFVAGTYAILALVRRRPSGTAVFAGIAAVLAAFLVAKKYTFVEPLVPDRLWDYPLALIGLSYMLFKFIHVLVDTWQGQIEGLTPFAYANYQLSFFALVAGPIQRFNDYRTDWERMDPGPGDPREILQAWNRILNGFIKMGLLAELAMAGYRWANAGWETQPPGPLLLRFLVFLYSYAVFLYFNFSGYVDIAVGSAKLFGFALPENFDRPYLARNVVDFWNRWHITLTHWMRDYVFMTSFKWSAEHFPGRIKTVGYLLLFLSLFLAGVWHGSTVNFAIFGLIHGVGAAAVQIYGDLLKWRLGRAGYHKYMKSGTARWIGVAVTFHYVCFSLVFFAMDARDARELLNTVWHGLTRSGGDA